MFEARIARVFSVFAGAIVVLAGQAVRLQIVTRDEVLDAQDARIHRRFVLSPRRGDILWKDGTPAATDEAGYVAEIDFVAYETPRWRCGACGALVTPRKSRNACAICGDESSLVVVPPADTGELAAILGVDRAEIERGVERAFAIRTKSPRMGRYPLLDHVSREAAVALALAWRRFPGVFVRAVRDRVADPSARAFVGRTRQAYLEDRARLTDPAREEAGLRVYSNSEVYAMRFGVCGLERTFDQFLRGDPGLANRQRAKDGGSLEPQMVLPVEDGACVTTTLRRDVQACAEEVVAAAPGDASAVVLDLEDGGIAAIASKSDDRLHHAVCGIRPGSVFKLYTALALLEAGVSPQATVRCDRRGVLPSGRRYVCDAAHGEVALEDAFAHSCNAYFETMAERIGALALREACSELGLDDDEKLGLAGTRAGVRPTFGSGTSLSPEELRFIAIGQGRALARPLQIAYAYGCIATDGALPEPHLRVGDERPADVSPEIARHAPLLRDAARRVVTSGTGSGIRELVEVGAAGKSGTADTSAVVSQNNAWFVAYAPHEHPRYVAVVVFEKVEGHGAAIVGPHVGRLLAQALR